jgi:hypothetical protein
VRGTLWTELDELPFSPGKVAPFTPLPPCNGATVATRTENLPPLPEVEPLILRQRAEESVHLIENTVRGGPFEVL